MGVTTVELVEVGTERLDVVELGDVAGPIVDALGELGPRVGVEVVPEDVGGETLEPIAERLVGQVAPGHADDPGVGWESVLDERAVERGDQLASGEVAGSAEEDVGVGHWVVERIDQAE